MQRTRRLFQGAFLALTLFGVFLLQGNAERWCPFGGVEALYTYLDEGNMTCSLGVSNFYALGGLLLTVLLLRRAFCSYVCPIGTITEWVGKLGARAGLGPHRVPRAADRVLSLAKYGVLALIVWVTWRAGELLFRAADPCYALLSRHGEDITFWAYVVSGAILAGALFTAVPFCRWLCPLAAVMNPLSRFGLTRVRRDAEACLDCGRCAEACPMQIPVTAAPEVTAARCTSCLSCVAACPATGAGALRWGPPQRVGRAWPPAALVVILLATIATVVTTAYAFPIPSFVVARGEAPAATATLELRVEGVTCRGSANLLRYFLFRDDVFEVPGYLRLEAWPDAGFARVRITYDPTTAAPAAIQDAIVTPYFSELRNTEDLSPFEIEGYAPWGGS
ncbi:MAG: 4Fe-4S binding protein [Planctomycetes bacterium]|nr:4Fe-4S binding protein [Planctomycetota bacterium]